MVLFLFLSQLFKVSTILYGVKILRKVIEHIPTHYVIYPLHMRE